MPVEQGAQQLLFVFYKMKSPKIQQQTNFKWVVEKHFNWGYSVSGTGVQIGSGEKRWHFLFK